MNWKHFSARDVMDSNLRALSIVWLTSGDDEENNEINVPPVLSACYKMVQQALAELL